MESLQHFDKFVWSLRMMGRTKEQVRFRAVVEFTSKGRSTREVLNGRAFANGGQHGRIDLLEGLIMLRTNVKLELTTRSDRYHFSGQVLTVNGFWIGIPYAMTISAGAE